MKIPLSTYRIQFTPSFGFTEGEKIVYYLKNIGISDIYASPIFESKRGSQHGYDMIDFKQIDSQLGGEKNFRRLIEEFKNNKIGWIQDIVPNHMAYHPSNSYINDVLEKGENSLYRDYFDIDWHSQEPQLKGKLLFPFLEKHLSDCLRKGMIRLDYQKNRFFIRYHDFLLPLNFLGFQEILSISLKQLPEDTRTSLPEKEADQIKWLLNQLNHSCSHPDCLRFWQELLAKQYYLLAYWKEARERINYRRFFSINELICLKVGKKHVFDATHQRIVEEVHKGNFTGLRIDHLDGLFNPEEYLQKLKIQTAGTYTVVEKILQPGEMLPSEFNTEGNTGYDFLYYLNNLFCQKKNKTKFLHIYHSFTGQKTDAFRLLLKKKRLILKQQMYGDLKNLTHLFYEHDKRYHLPNSPTLSRNKLLRALQEVMIRMPVYRTYLTLSNLKQKELKLILKIITQTKNIYPKLYKELDYLSSQFIHPLLEKSALTKNKDEIVNLIMRWQQFTGPLMAKGMEDTLLYCYYPLLSLNEVGGEPQNFGITKSEFNRFIQRRKQKWPYSMNTTMTHDCKRGEDVRARINVLSEIPIRWQEKLEYWHQLNLSKKKQVHSLLFPDKNMEYFIYQTLLGTLPFSGFSGIHLSYIERIQEYSIKSAREAKTFTSWLNPYMPYEKALKYFIADILGHRANKKNEFLNDLLEFHGTISFYGILNSLSQISLKLTCPGVPDFYQGSELWDFRLVDPDNRGPVDYHCRIDFLEEMQKKQGHKSLLSTLLANPAEGKVKLYLISQLLALRNKEPELFLKGTFVPLPVQGKFRNHIISFFRMYKENTILIVAPRFYTDLIKSGEYPQGKKIWQDTTLELPISNQQKTLEWISQESIILNNHTRIDKILQYFPVAVILFEKGV